RRQALKRCSEKLPEREREVVRRRYDQAEPVESIAAWLKTTRGAVDTLLFRIRKALHACVQGKLPS
ncbi:MAG TPA: sigma factor-like helix-turn-helix DNA-binding protein, partial [Planctomycetota bacterium]|nr:sigma factor-like helix-turn-helix DNA-binding protein [Planctomycetota bacterium]